jgi:hypothetical protein
LFSAAFETGAENKPVIAAVNRCATKIKSEIKFFNDLLMPRPAPVSVFAPAVVPAKTGWLQP